MQFALPATIPGVGGRSTIRPLAVILIAVVVPLALLLVSCSVGGHECTADSDCDAGEYCQNAGGVFVRGAVCVPNPPSEISSDGANRDASIDGDGTGGEPICGEVEFECESSRCERSCSTNDGCTFQCGVASRCEACCPPGRDCSMDRCLNSSCELTCQGDTACRMEDCKKGDCKLTCSGPDCVIEKCDSAVCTVVCLGGRCTIETCGLGSTCRLRCEDSDGDCDLACNGDGCECDGNEDCESA